MRAVPPSGLRVRRAADRPTTLRPGIVARHAFAFGSHAARDLTGVGALAVLNEERVSPGAGYGDHEHRGVDVVSWVAGGEVEHAEPGTPPRRLGPGWVAVLRAGSGAVHAERCPADAPGPLVLLQSWLRTPVGPAGGEPRYDAADTGPLLAGGALVAVAAGPGGPDAPVRLSVPGAVLRAARPRPGERLPVPVDGAGWLHVVHGRVRLGGGAAPGRRLVLEAGDGLPLGSAPGAPTGPLGVVAVAGDTPVELLVWSVPAGA